MSIQLKRIYEPVKRSDGTRILVDRLWPRGIAKARAKLDLWLKDIAPSTELRKWFNHDPKKWQEFQKRYLTELSNNQEPVKQLRHLIKTSAKTTLLFGARDLEHNEAQVILKYLARKKRTEN